QRLSKTETPKLRSCNLNLLYITTIKDVERLQVGEIRNPQLSQPLNTLNPLSNSTIKISKF
ncbi:hypothetical protein LINPERHAP1_LOCUS37303, partial [Linum perenne]